MSEFWEGVRGICETYHVHLEHSQTTSEDLLIHSGLGYQKCNSNEVTGFAH